MDLTKEGGTHVKYQSMVKIKFFTYTPKKMLWVFNNKNLPIHGMRRLFACLVCLFLFFCPVSTQADEFEVKSLPSPKEIASVKEMDVLQDIVESPKIMTQKEIDDLLGEDPYLGQTSWLGGKVDK